MQKNIVKDRITSFTFSYVVKGHPHPSPRPPTQAVGHEGESVSFQINPCLINTFLLFKGFRFFNFRLSLGFIHVKLLKYIENISLIHAKM